MGYSYALDSFILIVAENPGLTLEEIRDINDKTYRAVFSAHLGGIVSSTRKGLQDFVEEREDRFYLRPNITSEDVRKRGKLCLEIAYGLKKYKSPFLNEDLT